LISRHAPLSLREEVDMETSTDVLIVGGGPVGLMLAGELQRRGIAHLIVDARPQPDYFCKALGITPRTLEIWDQIGVLEDALRHGLFAAGMSAAVNGQDTETEHIELGAMPYGFLFLAQYDTERILRRHLERHGGRVRQGVTLIGFEQRGDGLRARVTATDRTEQTIDCRYLVGCDGARSAVRRAMGIDYEGDAYPMTFMLGDVRVHWSRPRPYGYRFTVTSDGALQNILVCIAVPGDPQRYRLSMAAPPEYWEEGADLETPPSMELLSRTVAPLLPAGATISDLRWSSFYRISHRIVSRYSAGRAFLAGDAAHIHPPIGGQGMNTGIQDAYNLGWKLALAARGRAAADLLDGYDSERRPVGQDVVDRTTRRMDDSLQEGQAKYDQWMQDSQLLIHYRGSHWVGEDVAAGAMARGPQPGDRAPEARGLRREWVADPVRLKELLRGTAHTLLLYFDEGAPAELYGRCAALADALRARCDDDLVLYGIVHPDARAVDHERFPLLTDARGEFAAAYGAAAPCLYLIRPDGHVGYRSDRIDAERLDSYLQLVFVAP
jgi:2-polyprenyl-6-methoxyphenol hydroxylase-like FAD-dependent oxidoreductase